MKIRIKFYYLGLLLFLFPLNGLVNQHLPTGLAHYWKMILEIPLGIIAIKELLMQEYFNKVLKIWAIPLCIFLYFALLMINEFFTYGGDFTYDLIVIIPYFAFFPIGLFLFSVNPNPKEIKFIFSIIKITGFFVTVLFYAQYFWGIEVSTPGTFVMTLNNSDVIRYGSTLDYSLALGAYLFFINMIILNDYLYGKNTRLKGFKWLINNLIFLFLFGLNISTQILSTSRASLYLTVIGILIQCVFIMKLKLKIMKKIYTIVALAIPFAIYVMVHFPDHFERIINSTSTTKDIANAGRVEIWTRSLSYFVQSPLLGHGHLFAGNISEIANISAVIVPESFLLQILLSTGIIGWLLFSIWFFMSVKMGLKLLVVNGNYTNYDILVTTCLISFPVYFLVLQIFQAFIVNMIIWFCFGLLTMSYSRKINHIEE